MKKLYFFLIILFVINIVNAQPGTLDNTFGTNGIVISTRTGSANAISIQADGKIVTAGSLNCKIGVIRYNTNGTLDDTFGTNGVVSTHIGSFCSVAYAISIQTDGKIVVAGYSSDQNANNDDIVVIRYNLNGSLDSTFGTNGGVIITPVGYFMDDAYALSIQADGKIVVAGDTYNGTRSDIVIVRYNSDGSLDNTFGTNGIAISTRVGNANAMSIQTDGKIVIAGSSDYRFMVARYNSNGMIDNTFGTNGVVTTSIYSDDEANAMSIQTDGKIVVAGNSGYIKNAAVVRYNSDGTLDNTFGTNGIVTTSICQYNAINAISIQTDGKIIIAGYSFNGSKLDEISTVIRYNSEGKLDSIFGTNGIVATSIEEYNYAKAIAIQNDGKIVVVGYNSIKDPTYLIYYNYFAVVRYNGDDVSANEYLDKKRYLMYPNPANSQITIESTQKIFLLTICDIDGQELKRQQINNTRTQLDISNLASGIYFVKLISDKTFVVRKIIKE
jgi:uncharacterized delta-60 repeat protein